MDAALIERSCFCTDGECAECVTDVCGSVGERYGVGVSHCSMTFVGVDDGTGEVGFVS